jgi:acetolactate synthase-1/2/3 large subunit
MKMSDRSRVRSGARILVDALKDHGVEISFGVPGESYLAVLDAMIDSSIEFVTCRQEGGAAMMAEAVGKLTGKPGICFVTRGPGATNASAGVHVAKQDSTPMILFVGQIDSDFRYREAFQEVDYHAFFGSMTKLVIEIDNAARIPELVARAFRVATQGRPGPVVVALPENMLTAEVTVADAPVSEPAAPHPGETDMATLGRMLEKAERPVVVVGGSRWSESAVSYLIDVAETLDLPVITSFRRQMLFPAHHRCYGGHLGIGPNPKLLQRIRESDLVILIGGRLGEMPSQSYGLFDIPQPQMPFVHVHPDAEELGKVYQPVLAVQATPETFVSALHRLARQQKAHTAQGWTNALHAEDEVWTETPGENTGEFQMGVIVTGLRGNLPPDAILSKGAAIYSGWLHRYYRFGRYGSQLAPNSGSMGYGVPAAIAAKLVRKTSTVVAFAGDGCFQMTCQELGTAVQHDAAIIIIVVDNGIYGTIRMHQEREYPARVFGTSMVNPDFAALARAYGAHAETVTATAEFGPAFERSRASGKAALIHVKLDPEAISPTTTLSTLRARSMAS